jgi:hypothetical protein
MYLLLENKELLDEARLSNKDGSRVILTLEHYNRIKHRNNSSELVYLQDLLTEKPAYLMKGSVEYFISIGTILE